MSQGSEFVNNRAAIIAEYKDYVGISELVKRAEISPELEVAANEALNQFIDKQYILSFGTCDLRRYKK